MGSSIVRLIIVWSGTFCLSAWLSVYWMRQECSMPNTGDQQDAKTDRPVYSGSSGDGNVGVFDSGVVHCASLPRTPQEKGQDPEISAPVAQLDRAVDFESIGRGFESLQAHQFYSQSRDIILSSQSLPEWVPVRIRIPLAPDHQKFLIVWRNV